jgi:hypothetical protein
MIRTTNDVMRSLLFQTSLLARYWAESLHTTTYLLNLLPTKAISTPSPTSLFSAPLPPTPTYGSSVAPATRTPLPQLPISSPPRSCRCVFLGYSSEHKGYQCLNLNTNRLLISQHIIFDEASFPFASSGTPPGDLDSLFSSSPTVCPIAPPYPSSTAGTSEPDVAPRAAPTPQPAPRAASALRFIEPPWCTSGDIRPPAPEPSRTRSSVCHPIIVVCDPGSTKHPPDGHPSCCQGHQARGSSSALCRCRNLDTVSGPDLYP